MKSRVCNYDAEKIERKKEYEWISQNERRFYDGLMTMDERKEFTARRMAYIEKYGCTAFL